MEPRSNALLFGLIGRRLGHSFSARYFREKFDSLGLDADYGLFELSEIKEVGPLLKNPALVGLNVTIPYKQAIIPFLDELAGSARKVGAVNTVARTRGTAWVGHNTDMPAFAQSLKNFCEEEGRDLPRYAMILGTGGASAAVQAALADLAIPFSLVSRAPEGIAFGYHTIPEAITKRVDLVVNTTPLGMYPDVQSLPPLPYHRVASQALAFDLVYNPGETAFMRAMKERGCPVRNGLEMLYLQAEFAWQIWETAIGSQGG